MGWCGNVMMVRVIGGRYEWMVWWNNLFRSMMMLLYDGFLKFENRFYRIRRCKIKNYGSAFELKTFRAMFLARYLSTYCHDVSCGWYCLFAISNWLGWLAGMAGIIVLKKEKEGKGREGQDDVTHTHDQVPVLQMRIRIPVHDTDKGFQGKVVV